MFIDRLPTPGTPSESIVAGCRLLEIVRRKEIKDVNRCPLCDSPRVTRHRHRRGVEGTCTACGATWREDEMGRRSKISRPEPAGTRGSVDLGRSSLTNRFHRTGR